ncbi:hypothetical protein MO973_19485 [Paenibacillus sp. TRM 82003]|nr:hypothetical protein [Paenibacillus sp. TRM 82003]
MSKLRIALELLEQAEKSVKEEMSTEQVEAFLHHANKAWLALYEVLEASL